ncbi:MAG: C25 family cysteine peptidase, partial [Actinomycetes bacterium]
DVYYAELTLTSDQNGRHHAFDANGNGFYGEYRWNKAEQTETSIDGIEMLLADVKVGRAPVLSGKEAQHFVDKVLAYETLVNADGEALDPQYLTRKLVVADVWRSDEHVAKHLPCWSDGAPPAAGEFVKVSGQPVVIVHLQPSIAAVLKNQPGARTRLVARFYAEWGGVDVPVAKQGTTADAAKDTWQFISPSGVYVVGNPPSDYVKLSGPAFAHKPECVLWCYSPADSCDDATTQAEELVDDGFNRFEEFSTERCVIETYAVPGAAVPLNMANVRAALDRGPHLVGVYGHGSENGLSYIYWHDNDAASCEFRNIDRPFIMYANSCLTANPGHSTVRSLGEILVTHKNGAVAYVGYTRIGFQEGHKQQQRFFKALDLYGRPGKAAEVRCAETLWQTYEQILYGDPEMPVWNKKPRRYLVIHPEVVDRTVKLRVVVLAKDGGMALKGQRVTLISGWRGSGDGPQFLTSGSTGDDGAAELDMAGWPESEATLSLTVTSANPAGEQGAYVPYRMMLPVYGYQRGWRRCKHCQALFHLNDRGSFCPRPGGGLHEAADGEKYRIIANAAATPASIQQGWRWCCNCQALHYPGTGEACHAAGGHNDAGSGQYAVEIIASPDTAKPAWRFCDNCRVLHLVKDGVTGPCHGGGTHVAGGSHYRVESA